MSFWNDVMDRLNYRLMGSGKKILLIHGNTGSQEDWMPLIKKLDLEKFQVLTYDLRGHGKSFVGKEKFSLDLFSDDLKKLLEHIDFSPEIYLGFSDGANVILNLMKNRYINDERVVLASGSFSPEDIKTPWYKLFTIIYNLTKISKDFGIVFKIHNRMRVMLKEYEFKKEDFGLCKNQMLLIVAERDMIKEGQVQKINDSFENSSLVVVKNSNHFNLIKKEGFFRIILEFIGG